MRILKKYLKKVLHIVSRRVTIKSQDTTNRGSAIRAERWINMSDYQEFLKKQMELSRQKAKEAEKKFQEQLSNAVEMHYSEYKNNYSNCKTVPNSYNKKTKTIYVYVNRVAQSQSNKPCPRCGSYCYGDCRA